ncbi:MAG: gephyrin-like molybdotransferase Glp, partial [Chloroflexota bacterium]
MSGDVLVRLEEACARMLAGVEALPAETVALTAAAGRVLAGPVTAVRTLPPWDSSAMDGYAVRAGDVASAADAAPVRLRVLGEVAAGHLPDAGVEPGGAVRILTGGIVPPGADAVVPVEHTDAPAGVADLPAAVTVLRPARAGDHIRRAGSDLRAGDLLVPGGTRIDARTIGLLAAAGAADVRVVRRPRVAVLSTGDELVPVGAPVGPAAIPDSNGLQGATQATETGAEVLRLGIVPDRRDAVLAALRDAIERADLVLTSGGVSVGAHDEVRDAFATVGRVDLWRVAIQPGKPIAFGHATAPDGRDVLLFGLPGNPVSAFVTFELFVRPALRRLGG